MKGRVLSALVAAVVCTSGAFAGPGVEFGSPGSTSNGDNGPWTLGYAFRVNNSNITVGALGYYDHDGNGFGQSHEVGLWDSAGTLLASVTVTTGDMLIGHFRYAPITPVNLLAGQSYVVGGVSGGQGGADSYTWNTTGHVVDSAITYSGDRWAGGGTLTFPTSTSGVANGFYGGNIHIGVIPGPGALAVLGLAGVIAPRRRRR